jgi:hypothetical protein
MIISYICLSKTLWHVRFGLHINLTRLVYNIGFTPLLPSTLLIL